MSRHAQCALVGAGDGIDPALVPTQTLYTGARIPVMGLGTFGSDHVSPERVAKAVEGAIAAGYRHLDCASIYGNERPIGEVLAALFDTGLRREDLWVTSTWLMEELVERLVRWNLHPADLITHRFHLTDVGQAYELMSSGRCGKVAVCFDEELPQRKE
jgi:threonine dehydrogenase-like Zn-dependent dehydrogenase